LSAVVYVGRPRLVDYVLELRAPRGIRMRPAPNLLSTNAYAVKRLLEGHTLGKQVEQCSSRFGRELTFSLVSLPLLLDRGTCGLAIWAVAASPDS
jgi:hypothetical protein